MAAPSLDSDHPGLKVLGEVAEVLAASFPSDEALSSVVGVLRRGLGLRRCRRWVRSPDGTHFAARIIDSLPVGLYVIDRSYHIRAWNRKRETGTEGVAREDAVGREVFEVLDRQPRELLKREFDRVFDTGEIQEVEVETQTPGGPRHYRITKVPMREDADDISHVITIGEDVTEWRRAQRRLAETEKLARL